jgi:carboxylesterase type B
LLIYKQKGQSAGSWSVGYHLIYKPSWPYFNQAILESGSPLQSTFRLLTSNEATDRSILIGKIVGCIDDNQTNISNQDLYECLQTADAKRMGTATLFGFLSLFNNSQLAYQKFVSLFPLVIDGLEFKELAKDTFRKNDFKKCNILTGFTTKETSDLVTISSYFGSNQFEYELKANLNYSYFKFLLDDYFSYYPTYNNNNFIDNLIDLYIPSYELLDETTNYYNHFIRITTDQLFRCPALHLAEYYAKLNLNVYVYLYGYRISTSPYPSIYGATHSDELAMVFGEPLSVKQAPLINFNPWSSTLTNYSIDERLISEQIINYWTNFIYNNDPNDKTNNNNNNNDSEWLKFKEPCYFLDYYFNSNRKLFYLNGNKSKNLNYLFYNDPICRFWQN